MASLSELFETVKPSVEDSRLAMETGRRLEPLLRDHQERPKMRICIQGDGGELLELPRSAVQLLFDILTEMAQGNAVTLVPTHPGLTTQQAAEFLNVSASHVESLLDDEQIPFRMVGHHREILLLDLMAYKRRSDAERQAALEELAELGQEIGEGL